jgi:DNA-binding beta-propeller fold protein YncE
VWSANSGVEVLTFAGHQDFVATFAFTPDGKHLASGGYDGVVKIWSLEPQQEVLNIITPPFYSRFALSPTDSHIAINGVFSEATGNHTQLMVWDIQKGELVFEQNILEYGRTVGVAFSPDGKEILVDGTEKTITVLDSVSGNLIYDISVEDDIVTAFDYHPDGNIFAAVGTSGMAQIFDRNTRELLQSWDAGLGQLSNVAFSPDGVRLAVTSSQTNDIKIFNSSTGNELLLLQGHANSNFGLDFNSDGTRLVSAGRDGTAKIWDAQTGELLLTLTGHTSTIGAVRFSPDDTLIATASADGTVRVWNAVTGKQTLEVEGFLVSVDFTPDGKYLVAPRYESEGVQIIALTIEELVKIAKSRLTRSLTLEECRKYLHVDICPNEP